MCVAAAGAVAGGVCACVAQLTKDVRKFLQKCLDEGKDFNLTSAIKSRIITDGA